MVLCATCGSYLKIARHSMLPNEIELPKPSEFIRESFSNECNTKHCFLGWMHTKFPRINNTEVLKVGQFAREVAVEMKLAGTEDEPFFSIVEVNDHPKNSKRRLATWFEKTIERLGYDIE